MRKLIAAAVLAATVLGWVVGAMAHPHPKVPCHVTEGCKGGSGGGK